MSDTTIRPVEDIADETIKAPESKVERRNPKTRQDHGYIIRYGQGYNSSFYINDQNIEDAFALYCFTKCTVEHVADEFELTREQFWALKTAFKIVKSTEFPFLPETIDALDPDQLADKKRVLKKKFALAKYKPLKQKDIEREIKKYNTAEYWFNKVLDAIVPLEPKKFNVEPFDVNKPYSDSYLIALADVHSGLKVDSIYNAYNISEMHRRFKLIFTYIVNHVPKDRPLTIIELGDIVHGIIHGSTDKHSEFIMKSLSEVFQAYLNLIDGLLTEGYEIIFAHSNGNHSALLAKKDARVDEENFGNLLISYLKGCYRNEPRFKIIDRLKGENHAVVRIPNTKIDIMTAHGDECNMETLAKKARAYNLNLGYNIKYVYAGHMHHYKGENFNDVLVQLLEPIGGTDQYAGPKGMNSPAGFNVIKFDDIGEARRFIDFRRIK